MTQPAGWYDDPQDTSKLRYWDGVVWSSHVTPKVSPTVEQSHIGMPYPVAPASARQPGPQDRGQAGGQWPAYGQGPGQLGQLAQNWVSHPPTTPDGALLAGWWLRVGACLLDGIFTFVLALPLTGWFYHRYLVGVVDWSKTIADQAAAGSTSVVLFPPWEILQYGFGAGVLSLLVSGVYEVLFLSRSGATPGKKIVGISVRLRDRAGPPPMKSALGRTACQLGFSLVSFGSLLDDLWPLWDDKRQAIHDKIVGTNVVVGPQPKRDA